jgi:hypothetical protein
MGASPGMSSHIPMELILSSRLLRRAARDPDCARAHVAAGRGTVECWIAMEGPEPWTTQFEF